MWRLKDTYANGRKYYSAMTSSKHQQTCMKKYEEFKVDQISSFSTEAATSAGSCAIRCLKTKKEICKGFQFIPKESDGICKLVKKTVSGLDSEGEESLYYESKKMIFKMICRKLTSKAYANDGPVSQTKDKKEFMKSFWRVFLGVSQK